jgi:4-amino-4-deoxy-L-arabinose transferase-like glycosyltransferase
MLPDEPIDALLFSIAVGFGIIGNLLLLLGLTATLHKFTIFFLFLILLGIAGHQGQYIASLIRGTLKSLTPPAENFAFSIFCLILFSLGAIFLLIFAMAPPVDWDSLMYHLQIPLKFIEENRIFLPADSLHVSFIGLAHMLYIPFLEIGSISGAALLSGFTALLFGLSVFVLAYRLFDRNAAYMSLAMLWGTSTILLVAITPRVDVTLCFYLILAHHALLTALYSNSKSRHTYFYLSAVLLGLSFGIKYSGLIYAACLSPLIVYVAFKNSHGLLNSSKKILVFGFTFLIIVFPWLGKNWFLLEAPLFPYFGESAKYSKYTTPWIESLSGSEPLAAKASVKRFVKNKSARAPLNLRDFFFNPGKITIEGEGRYYYSNLLFFLLPLGVFSVRKRPLAWLVLPAILYIGLIYIHLPRTNIRYLLPAIAPFTVAVGFITNWICQHIKPPKISIIFAILLITVSLALTTRVAGRYFDQTKAVKHVFGRISSAKYMEKYEIGAIRNLSLMLNYVNKNLPADSVVLMLFEARSFYFRPQAIQDVKRHNWPLLLNVLASDECLQRVNVTHVLINQGSLNYYTKRGTRFSPTGLKALRRYTDQCLELVHETRAHRLYKVKNE